MNTRWRLVCLRADGWPGLVFTFKRRDLVERVCLGLSCSFLLEAYEVAL